MVLIHEQSDLNSSKIKLNERTKFDEKNENEEEGTRERKEMAIYFLLPSLSEFECDKLNHPACKV